jgi:hypothetical protein
MVPTTSSSNAIEESLLALAWSLWAELGVSAWSRHHAAWYVDLEPLILLTAALSDSDPRLRDEATDWCIRYARFVSATRLRTLLRLSDDRARRAFHEYAATVAAHTRVNWPSEGAPRPYQPTGRSRLDSLERPSLFGLRVRTIFGTGGRAEIVRILASAPDRAYAASEIAEEAAFTTRAIEQELDSLIMGGVVRRVSAHGRRRIQVARPETLLPFVGDRPTWSPRWAPLVRVLLAGYRLMMSGESLPPIVRAVEARKYQREAEADVESAGLTKPGDSTTGAEIWDEVVGWLQWVTSTLAAGDPRVLSSGPRTTEGNELARTSSLLATD